MNPLRGYFFSSFTLSPSLHLVHNMISCLLGFLASPSSSAYRSQLISLFAFSTSLRRLLFSLLMSYFIPIFLLFSSFRLGSSVPVVFTSCPGIEGGERRRKERNANFVTTVTVCRRRNWKRRERKMSLLSGKWDGHCTLLASPLKDQGDSLSDIVWFFSALPHSSAK